MLCSLEIFWCMNIVFVHINFSFCSMITRWMNRLKGLFRRFQSGNIRRCWGGGSVWGLISRFWNWRGRFWCWCTWSWICFRYGCCCLWLWCCIVMCKQAFLLVLFFLFRNLNYFSLTFFNRFFVALLRILKKICIQQNALVDHIHN